MQKADYYWSDWKSKHPNFIIIIIIIIIIINSQTELKIAIFFQLEDFDGNARTRAKKISSIETGIDTRLAKAWTAIDRLSVIWNSDLTDKMKRGFFQAAIVSILLYGCTTWTLTKRM